MSSYKNWECLFLPLNWHYVVAIYAKLDSLKKLHLTLSSLIYSVSDLLASTLIAFLFCLLCPLVQFLLPFLAGALALFLVQVLPEVHARHEQDD